MTRRDEAGRQVRAGYVSVVLAVVSAALGGCASTRPGTPVERRGDEIMVCGQLFHTGAPVVLWTDPGGYDAYRVEKRFAPWEKSAFESKLGTDGKPVAGSIATPNRYGVRFGEAARGIGGTGERLPDDVLERVRGGGWDLPTLRQYVDQFVIHYDVCGTSRQCFRVLHDMRGLSVHFMLDIDGTIYQTLDVKERAWQATTSNDRSVGIEIANIGAYPAPKGWDSVAEADRVERAPKPLSDWYKMVPFPPNGFASATVITLPASMGDGGVRTPKFTGMPMRPWPVTGVVQGEKMVMYDLTAEQYESLARLTATLCTVLPGIACDVPRDAEGKVVMSKLTDEQLRTYHGILGHYHIQENKTDPGPAFQWELVVERARGLMK